MSVLQNLWMLCCPRILCCYSFYFKFDRGNYHIFFRFYLSILDFKLV